MPGGDHEAQLLRSPHEQQLQLAQRIRAQLLHVVDHEPNQVRERGQVR